jgi:hypothetical protein
MQLNQNLILRSCQHLVKITMCLHFLNKGLSKIVRLCPNEANRAMQLNKNLIFRNRQRIFLI